MVSFMHSYKKIKKSFLLALLFAMAQWLFVAQIWAATSNILIKNAELVMVDDAYVLNADFDIDFNTTIEEALNKGVPLNFLIEFQVVSPRKYWFDDEIDTETMPVSMSYHALTRQYLVNVVINKQSHQKAFSTLNEALADLSRLRDWKVLDKSLIEKGVVYNAALLMRLDQKKLPKVLQVEALSSEDWSFTSQKFQWVPTFLK